MTHALIIDGNGSVGGEIPDRLAKLGFASFDHVWTEKEAIWAADRRPPNLVVVAHADGDDNALEAGLYVSLAGSIPLLVIAENGFRTRQRLSGSHRVCGPFTATEMETALANPGIAIVQQSLPQGSEVEQQAYLAPIVSGPDRQTGLALKL